MENWKLVAAGKLINGGYDHWKNYQTSEWKLYDMETDRSEQTDLSGRFPEKVHVTIMERMGKCRSRFPSPTGRDRAADKINLC